MSLLDGPAINSSVIRSINRSNVLRMIMERGPLSRIEIAKLNGLTQSTVSRIVDKLIKEGLVYEQSKGNGALGRKPINLVINEQSRIAGIIAISPVSTVIAVCDLGGNELALEKLPTALNREKRFLSFCAEKLVLMIESQDVPLAGVGVTLPGAVNPTEGSVRENSFLNWGEINVRRIVEEYVTGKVLVENSAKAGALAELCFLGEAVNLSDFVFIQVGRQIETGIVINRSLYQGARGLGGQFGKNEICTADASEGSRKVCSLNEAASENMIRERYYQLAGQRFNHDFEEDINQIVQAAINGETYAVAVIKEAASNLGKGISYIINGLSPERIIVDGRITQAWNLIFPEIAMSIDRNCELHLSFDKSELVMPSSMSMSSFEGALALILQDMFGGYYVSHRQFSSRNWVGVV